MKTKRKKEEEPKGFQFVNFYPLWRGFRFGYWSGSLRYVFDWYLNIGFWEIRKWQTKSMKEIDSLNHD